MLTRSRTYTPSELCVVDLINDVMEAPIGISTVEGACLSELIRSAVMTDQERETINRIAFKKHTTQKCAGEMYYNPRTIQGFRKSAITKMAQVYDEMLIVEDYADVSD